MTTSVVGVESALTPLDMELLHSSFRNGYEAILACRPLESEPGSGVFFEPVGEPQLVIINVS